MGEKGNRKKCSAYGLTAVFSKVSEPVSEMKACMLLKINVNIHFKNVTNTAEVISLIDFHNEHAVRYQLQYAMFILSHATSLHISFLEKDLAQNIYTTFVEINDVGDVSGINELLMMMFSVV